MRILIDGRFIGVGESISRYTLEIVKGILELDNENDYTLLIRPQGQKLIADSLQLKAKNFHLKILDIPHYSLAEQTKLLKFLNAEKFDLVHFTQFNHPVRYKGKFVVSIHDLTLLGHLYRMNFLKKIGFRVVMKSAVRNSEKIITISETSKKDIVETYKADPKKIEVTYLGVDEKYNSELGTRNSELISFRKKYGISENYILYTGMWKRHKNLLRMFGAFERFKTEELKNLRTEEQKGTQLVLVGKIDKEELEVLKRIDEINSRIMNNESRIKNSESQSYNSSFIPHNSDRQKPITATGFINEEELPIAYAGALAYVIPSLSEGFGLPPLEAMSCGTPVLSSNISAMPEILGDAALYFDPYNVNDMAKAMKKIVEDKDLQSDLSKAGLEQAKKYDWGLTAKKTLEVYKSVLK